MALCRFVLQLVLRENDLIELPKELAELTRLRELHVQGNRLTFLPPELGMLTYLLSSGWTAFKLDFVFGLQVGWILSERSRCSSTSRTRGCIRSLIS